MYIRLIGLAIEEILMTTLHYKKKDNIPTGPHVSVLSTYLTASIPKPH